ncbi:biotin transporter BioY [Rhizobium sp. YIM 134829]|uniref:biotin transporter BioY n=1 Tax=Rhizobium sp. YIM 134829 TaxID=3390453 RepID=UPI00397956D6
MSGLETAIRQALERSDRTSPETRARIYQSARNALEAGLRKQNIVDATVVAQQRHRLETVIHGIEQEERIALSTAPSVPPPPVPPAPADHLNETDRPGEPRLSAVRELGRPPRAEPAFQAPPSPAITPDSFFDRRPNGQGSSAEPPPLTASPAAERQDARGAAAPSLDDVHADPAYADPPGVRGGSLGADRSIFEDLRPDRAFGSAPAGKARVAEPPVLAAEPRLGGGLSGRRGRGAGRAAVERVDDANDLGLPGAEPLVPRRRRRRGRWLSGLAAFAILVGAIGSATWWVVSTGLLSAPSSPALTPNSISAENFDGSAGLRTLGAEAGFSGDWTDVYRAGEGEATPGPAARIETLEDDAGKRLRITSSADGPEGSVSIAVPPEILASLSGKTSTMALGVRAEMGKPTQFSVECDFGSLGGCGRHRFTVNDETSDMLFKISFDRSLAPSTPGKILINSDVSGRGAALDLSVIRLLPGQ